MTTKTTRYGIMISTGNRPHRWISGWDTEYATRAEAEAAKQRADRQEGWAAKVVAIKPEGILTAVLAHDTVTVRDAEGGVWWPSHEAEHAINRAPDRKAEALRICRTEPMRGTWAS